MCALQEAPGSFSVLFWVTCPHLRTNPSLFSPRKLHSGMKTYGCELCGKRFLDSLRLRMHLLAHSGGLGGAAGLGMGGFLCLSTQGCCGCPAHTSPLQQTRAEPAAPFPGQHVANLFSSAQ